MQNINVISSFISIYSEINTNSLNKYLIKKEKNLCLPVVLSKDKHLIFKKYNNNDELVKGNYNILQPPEKNEILIPEILFIPCLAFDNKGYRLGYGGGYYDKTLNFLKKENKNFISVGYAFDEQKVERLPIDNHDIKLNYVMTEKNIYSFS